MLPCFFSSVLDKYAVATHQRESVSAFLRNHPSATSASLAYIALRDKYFRGRGSNRVFVIKWLNGSADIPLNPLQVEKDAVALIDEVQKKIGLYESIGTEQPSPKIFSRHPPTNAFLTVSLNTSVYFRNKAFVTKEECYTLCKKNESLQRLVSNCFELRAMEELFFMIHECLRGVGSEGVLLTSFKLSGFAGIISENGETDGPLRFISREIKIIPLGGSTVNSDPRFAINESVDGQIKNALQIFWELIKERNTNSGSSKKVGGEIRIIAQVICREKLMQEVYAAPFEITPAFV